MSQDIKNKIEVIITFNKEIDSDGPKEDQMRKYPGEETD